MTENIQPQPFPNPQLSKRGNLRAVYELGKSRLSKRVTFWIFLSLVFIETLIFIPSYLRREQELLEQKEAISKVVLDTVVRFSTVRINTRTLIQEAKMVAQQEDVLGLAIYTTNGKLLQAIGEQPTLTYSDMQGQQMLRLHNQRHNYYEVAWILPGLNNRYIVIVRHDTHSVQRELYAYTVRIILIVLLISVVLTLVTMVVLGKMVIAPILSLKEDLGRTAQALSEDQTPNFYAISVQRNDELGEVMQAFQQMYDRVAWEISERKQAEAKIRTEQEQSEKLLLNILPQPIAEQLKAGKRTIAEGFTEVTILFADLVNFTTLSEQLSAQEVVTLLNQIFSAFDELTEKYSLEKIKTIGDAYMVVGGIPLPCENHAEAIANMALDMQQIMREFNQQQQTQLSLRIGINTGAVVAGVIGTKKFIYDLWGDAVNIASRMESHGVPKYIQVTEATYSHLQYHYHLQQRGEIEVKGKGKMTTYWLLNKR